MTTTPQPPQHGIGNIPAAPQRKSRVGWILGGAGVLAVLLCGGIVAAIAAAPDEQLDRPGTVVGSIAADAPAPPVNAEPADEPAGNYGTPGAKDFKLSIKVLDKQCFGSAGCNVTYRVDLKQVTATSFDPAKTYEITYTIKGGESEIVGTGTIEDGDQWVRDEQEFTSTKNEKSKLTATIATVEEL